VEEGGVLFHVETVVVYQECDVGPLLDKPVCPCAHAGGTFGLSFELGGSRLCKTEFFALLIEELPVMLIYYAVGPSPTNSVFVSRLLLGQYFRLFGGGRRAISGHRRAALLAEPGPSMLEFGCTFRTFAHGVPLCADDHLGALCQILRWQDTPVVSGPGCYDACSKETLCIVRMQMSSAETKNLAPAQVRRSSRRPQMPRY
jgi:hypothetical protein